MIRLVSRTGRERRRRAQMSIPAARQTHTVTPVQRTIGDKPRFDGGAVPISTRVFLVCSATELAVEAEILSETDECVAETELAAADERGSSVMAAGFSAELWRVAGDAEPCSLDKGCAACVGAAISGWARLVEDETFAAPPTPEACGLPDSMATGAGFDKLSAAAFAMAASEDVTGDEFVTGPFASLGATFAGTVVAFFLPEIIKGGTEEVCDLGALAKGAGGRGTNNSLGKAGSSAGHGEGFMENSTKCPPWARNASRNGLPLSVCCVRQVRNESLIR